MSQVRSTCRGKPFLDPNPEPLPKVQKEKGFPFQLVSIDYAGPIYYRLKSKIELKAYIQLFSRRASIAACWKFVVNSQQLNLLEVVRD